MKKLVIIDGNSLINRAYYGVGFLSTSKGEPINAVHGFLKILLNILKNLRPSHVVVAFDVKAPTFRKKLYNEYKAQRRPQDVNLTSQFPILKEILDAMNIARIEMPGFEADDLIGTITKRFDGESLIITSDGDSYQLISDNITVLKTQKGFTDVDEIDEKRLFELEGLKPKQIIDYKALRGDSSDNIPGAPGIGEKKAKALLEAWGSVENIYNNIDKLDAKIANILTENKEIVELSYKLATIDTNVNIKENDDDFVYEFKVDDNLIEVIKKYELKQILSIILSKSPEHLEKENAIKKVKIETINIDNIFDFANIMTFNEKRNIAIHIDNERSYLSFAFDNTKQYIANFMYIDFNFAFKTLRELVKNNRIITYNLKDVMHLISDSDLFEIYDFDDLQIMYYLIDSNRKNETLSDIFTEEELKDCPANFFNKYNEFKERMDKYQLKNVYENYEKPLVKVLYSMEKTGFKIDVETLDYLSSYFDSNIRILQNKIYELAGRNFNINSPKQLGEVLFNDLKLKPSKKSKTGSYSTNVDVLNGLIDDHEIIKYILNYREVNKLSSTYIEPIKTMLDGNNRIHTCFKQTLTSTGRLSSSEPNLQNIPMRKQEGRELRKMFVASDGNVLVAADYSQIELRLMAHLSGDEKLISAYNEGKDIHAITASKIFNCPLDMVTAEMRRQAKAVNFGIIYGISSFGLASDIKIPVFEAKKFIDTYFATYPVVKEYIDSLVKGAVNVGYVKSISGRIRFIPEIFAQKKNERMQGERMAMNMPLQGSASDVIKLAMIKVYEIIKERNLKARLILQVHDELIIDCPENEAEEVSQILNETMENVAQLRVKLIADVKIGKSWYETK